MLRCTIKVAALLLGGILLLSPIAASAEDKGSGQQPPPQGAEQKPDAKTEGQPNAEEQAKAAERQAIQEYEEALQNLPSSSGQAECVWTGRRITSLLWRDDIDTAHRYMELYDRFGCSADHLKLAFRCVIRQGPIDAKAADKLAARVQSCWIDPDQPTTASTQATTGTTIKGGTIPN
jgi:hypothetical protein